MEVPGKRTDSDGEVKRSATLCEPCQNDDVNTTADGLCKECDDYMCTTCFRQHLRAKSCRNHTLMDINSSSETCLKRHYKATKCKQHEGEVIKFYCRQHESVGCGDCMVLGHNACKLEYIKDFTNNFHQNEEYKTFMRKIETLISERKTYEEKIQENKQVNTAMLEKALQDIKQFRLKINKYFDKVETDITRQVKHMMDENETLLTKLENDCTMLSTKLDEITNMLNSELYKDNVLFIHTFECKPKLSETEKALSNMRSRSMKRYEFVCDQQLRNLITSAEKLGTLAISTVAVFPQTTEGVSEQGVRSVVAVGARVRRNFADDRRDDRRNERRSLLETYADLIRWIGTVTDVHDDRWVTVKWDHDGHSERRRIGVGGSDVTLIQP